MSEIFGVFLRKDIDFTIFFNVKWGNEGRLIPNQG